MRANKIETFTYVAQTEEDFLLDIVVMTPALDGYIETIKPIESSPGMYSVVAQLPTHWARGWYQLASRD